MPIPTEMVGETVGPMRHEIDARWTMSYSAALGDTNDCYFDTRRAGGIVAHPLFPVCVEWPVIVAGRETADKWGITPDETRRSVHATHDTHIHRLVRPGDVLETKLTYAGVEQRSPGAFTTLRLDTTDVNDEPVATTWQGGFHLGVGTVGEDRPDETAPALPGAGVAEAATTTGGNAASSGPKQISVPVAAGAAHLYSEAARIWNPIHTDAAIAEMAGLPEIILHGTATMALGVSAAVREAGGDRPERVRRISGRFASMVLMPSTLGIRIGEPTPQELTQTDPVAAGDADLTGVYTLAFEVLTEAGDPAVSNGTITLTA